MSQAWVAWGLTASLGLVAAACGQVSQDSSAAGASNGGASSGGSSAGGAGGGRSSTGAAAGVGAAIPIDCAPVAHPALVSGPASADFASVSTEALGIYQVIRYFEQADSCALVCPAKAAGPYLLVRRQDGLVRACTCATIADCEAQARAAACGADYQADFDRALSAKVLAGKSGSVRVVDAEQPPCSGSTFDVQLTQLSPDLIRIDGSGVFVAFPAVLDFVSGIRKCSQTDVENAAAGQACNRVQVLEAERVPDPPVP